MQRAVTGIGKNRLIVISTLLAATMVSIGISDALELHSIDTDSGGKAIVVAGEFLSDDDITDFRKMAVSESANFVSFDSPGGNVLKAIELGREIRALDLDTIQLRSMECASACALAFMGGVNRFAEPGSIGMHKSSFSSGVDVKADDAVSSVQYLTAEIIQYMVEMGVDPSVLQLALRYDADDIRYLSKSEMLMYRISTVSDAPAPQARETGGAASVPPPSSDTTSPATMTADFATGRVHHPRGGASLKAEPETTASNDGYFLNGTPIEILEKADGWFRLKVEGQTGWMEISWVSVDGYVGGQTEDRYIQVASIEARSDAERMARSRTPSLWVFETGSGLFALTLPSRYSLDEAKSSSRQLKSRHAIPSDSFIHYGNTFIKKVCCDNNQTAVSARLALYQGVDFYGQDISQSRLLDAVQCATACLKTSQCMAFTFNANPRLTKGPNCFLKSGVARTNAYTDAFSGLFLLDPHEIAPTFSISADPRSRQSFPPVDVISLTE